MAGPLPFYTVHARLNGGTYWEWVINLIKLDSVIVNIVAPKLMFFFLYNN